MVTLKKFLVTAVGTVVGMLLFAPAALAQAVNAPDNAYTVKQWIALAAGFVAFAAAGGAIGQGKAVAATLEGIARNPGASGKMFVPMILGLALIESLVIYSLVISFMLIGKLGEL